MKIKIIHSYLLLISNNKPLIIWLTVSLTDFDVSQRTHWSDNRHIPIIKLNGEQPGAPMKEICCLHWGQLVETVLQYYLSTKIAGHMAAANGSSPLPELRYGIRWFRHSLCGLGLHLAHWFRACFPVEDNGYIAGIKPFSGFSLAEAATS